MHGVHAMYSAKTPRSVGCSRPHHLSSAAPWADSVTRRKHALQTKQPKVTVDEAGEATLHLRMQNETNIEVRLTGPIEVRLPHGPETISKVTLYADDSPAFLEEVRRARPR